jgi:hypothetical protein
MPHPISNPLFTREPALVSHPDDEREDARLLDFQEELNQLSVGSVAHPFLVWSDLYRAASAMHPFEKLPLRPVLLRRFRIGNVLLSRFQLDADFC